MEVTYIDDFVQIYLSVERTLAEYNSLLSLYAYFSGIHFHESHMIQCAIEQKPRFRRTMTEMAGAPLGRKRRRSNKIFTPLDNIVRLYKFFPPGSPEQHALLRLFDYFGPGAEPQYYQEAAALVHSAAQAPPCDPEEPDLKVVVAGLFQHHPCSNCGFRCVTKEELTEHLDAHYHERQHMKKNVRSRQYFPSAEEWISPPSAGKENASSAKAPPEKEQVTEHISMNRMKCDKCAICAEFFDPLYWEEGDEWVYENAMTRPTDKTYVHVECYEDNKKN